MTPEQFVYWLQGFMEMTDPTELTSEQTQMIKDHLNTIFEKVTPDRKKKPTVGLRPSNGRGTVYC